MEREDSTFIMGKDAVDGSAYIYRFSKITEIQKEIERERDKRATLCTIYNKSVKIISGIDDVLGGTSILLAISGIGVLSTVIADPLVIAMEVMALVAEALRFIGGRVNKKNSLALKAEKHEKIKTLAEAKHNTISDYISKALEDDNISGEEYSLILKESVKFNDMKEEIRSKIKVSIDEETKQSIYRSRRHDGVVHERVREKTSKRKT